MSIFDPLELLPEDAIFSIPKLFSADPRPRKVNLGIGSYEDAEGKSYILDCVRDAEAFLFEKKPNKDYLPIEGAPDFLKEVKELVFGKALSEAAAKQLFSIQTVGGTGALFLGGQLFSALSEAIYLPNTTWPNHRQVFNRCGLNILQYAYYDEKEHRVDFKKMCQDAFSMPPGSIILLHACCQNPTGMDLSEEEWKELSSILKEQEAIPFFDFAYQGFKKSIDEDAFAVRYFAEQGHEMLVAQSFAKNFGLYGERAGSLSVIAKSADSTQKIGSQLKRLARSVYSNPPRHGADIITHILSSEQSKKVWLSELKNMRDRLREMRHTLSSGLQAKGTDRDWRFLDRQNGFFSFCGLTESQVHRMIKDHAVYMPFNGRINVSGLNGHNMDYVIEAILDVTQA